MLVRARARVRVRARGYVRRARTCHVKSSAPTALRAMCATRAGSLPLAIQGVSAAASTWRRTGAGGGGMTDIRSINDDHVGGVQDTGDVAGAVVTQPERAEGGREIEFDSAERGERGRHEALYASFRSE